MTMVSMKTDDGPRECIDNPYGYGLRLRLNDDQCEALGISTPPSAGSKLTLHAVAYVASATQSVEEDGDDAGPDVFLELQITDMELVGAGSGSNPASVLYAGT